MAAVFRLVPSWGALTSSLPLNSLAMLGPLSACTTKAPYIVRNSSLWGGTSGAWSLWASRGGCALPMDLSICLGHGWEPHRHAKHAQAALMLRWLLHLQDMLLRAKAPTVQAGKPAELTAGVAAVAAAVKDL